jgi:hypothetical protein
MFMSARLALAALVCVGLVWFAGGCHFAVDTVGAALAQLTQPARAQPGMRSDVYAALLSGMSHHGVPGSQMLVKDEWIPIPAISDSAVAEWLQHFNIIPAQLREAVRRPALFKPGPVDRSVFPAGTRFISEAAIDAVFTHSLIESWTAFKDQYMSEGWVEYSHVLATSDGLDALVYTEAHCGGLCGHGGYIWLHRTGRAAAWSIKKVITSWIA